MGLGIGTGEILLVLIVALIIWGPGKLPEIARTLGKTMRALRKATYDFTSTMTREIEEQNKPQSKPGENPHPTPRASSPHPGAVSTPKNQNEPRNPERQQQQNE